jgi:hypothetical protein
MGVQKKILKRMETIPVPNAAGKSEYGTAALIGGTPGQIYDVAYGPVVHTTTLTEAADIGSFVKGQGIIVNAPEYALYGASMTTETGTLTGGPLAPSLTLPTGSVVSCMTAGHVWMTRKAFADMGDAANAYIIWQQPIPAGESEEAHANDLIIVEINGLGSYGPGSGSNANG